MWQTDISIGREYNLRQNIDKYLKDIDIKYTWTKMGNRDVFSVADRECRRYEMLKEAICRLFLHDIKYKYLIDNTGIQSLSGMILLLFTEMMFFDSKYERDYVYDILTRQCEYSLDGIFNFLLGDIKANWDYLAEIFGRTAYSDEDMLLLAKYMHESSINNKMKLYLTYKNDRIYVFDIRSGYSIPQVNVTGDRQIDTLFTLISSHAKQLYVQNDYKFNIDTGLISNVMNVEFI